MRGAQRPWLVLLPLWLAACATAPLPRTPAPAATASAARPPRAAMVGPSSVIAGVTAPAPVADDVWQRLRDSFAMQGCDASPAVLDWAQRYTRHPQSFEERMRAALPRLVYVQESAARHGVAGEFALLPWVESHYRPAPAPRPKRPAGIWQIMPATAGSMGLRVNRAYDGRLDLAASTEGVMRLLHRYHQRYDDWKLVDRAYNAGESAMRQQRADADSGTREHLAKLLAIACVVREPARFHVTLPTLPAGQQLVEVPVDHSMQLARAARHAGMSTAALTELNAGFRNGTLDTRYASHLLLPESRAEQFRDALAKLASAGSAHTGGHGNGPRRTASPAPTLATMGGVPTRSRDGLVKDSPAPAPHTEDQR